MSRKLFLFLEERLHSKKVSSLIVTFLFVIVTALCLYGLFFGLAFRLFEISQSVNYKEIEQSYEKGINFLQELFEKLCRKSRLFSKAYDVIFEVFRNFEVNLSSFLSEVIPDIISACVKFISFFPTFLVFLFMTFIASFYIGVDYEKIRDFLLLQLSDNAKDLLEEIKSTLSHTAKALFKSYFLLTVITFFQLLFGFYVLGIKHAPSLALIISFVDLLPILGTGTVLIPWSLICILSKSISRGVGIAVLYVVILIFRRIAEPKIVGDGLGLSPLLSLICIFVGFKIWGFIGILVFPVLVLTVMRLNEKGFIVLYKNKKENSEEKVKKAKERFLNFKYDDDTKT